MKFIKNVLDTCGCFCQFFLYLYDLKCSNNDNTIRFLMCKMHFRQRIKNAIKRNYFLLIKTNFKKIQVRQVYSPVCRFTQYIDDLFEWFIHTVRLFIYFLIHYVISSIALRTSIKFIPEFFEKNYSFKKRLLFIYFKVNIRY